MKVAPPHPVNQLWKTTSRKGAVLMLVLWAVALLSTVLVKVYGLMRLEVDSAVVEAKTLRARLLAESGLALARHPEIGQASSLLHRGRLADAEWMRVRVRSEAARLNLNRVLAQADDRVMIHLLTGWGLSLQQAQQVKDRLADWVDPDDLTRLNGAERVAYREAGQPAYPLNRPFQSLHEIREVLGVAGLLDETYPDWEDSITIYGDGVIDLQEAPAPVIAAVCGVTAAQAALLVRVRSGRDGKDGTEDDLKFTQVQQPLAVMGLGQAEIESLGTRVQVGSKLKRIESTGFVGGGYVTITEIAFQGAASRQILARWEQTGPP